MDEIKTIALVAHDSRKADLIEWVTWNHDVLLQHHLVCTGTTGQLVENTFREIRSTHAKTLPEKKVRRLKSGPLGGDQQLGALIAEGKIDIMIFLWDPMEPQPHDVDVKALLRISALYNIPIASNRSTADFLISSPLFTSAYEPRLKDYSYYIQRSVHPGDSED